MGHTPGHADDRASRATPDTSPQPASASGAAGSLRQWSGWRYEGLAALELTALVALAVSRPVLDSFGRSPETFVARGADTATIVWFGLAVALVPALAVSLVGLASRALGGTVRGWAHLGLVAVAGGVAVWRLGRDVTGRPGGALLLVAAGAVGGVVLAAVRWRLPSSSTFLRFAGLASVVFLVQFLLMSPTATLVTGDGPQLDAEVAAGVSASLSDDPPDVVVVVFDALPTESLLDGTGQIDAELYPRFAELAEMSTWYRNDTAVAPYTTEALPAVLTGRYPNPDYNAYPPPDPENLFTLLGGTYDLHVREQVTRLCPTDLCRVRPTGGLRRLLGDAADLWGKGATDDESDAGGSSLPAVMGSNRYEDATTWIDQQRFGTGGRPDLYFYHSVLPHDVWQFLGDGTRYQADEHPTGFFGLGWTRAGATVGRQRHQLQLQTADRLLGRLLDRLRAADSLDDTLLVVTADHGQAFVPGEPWRTLSAGNAHQIMWTPLLVKEPGQASGRVSDDDVRAIDVVPTIADLLGVEIPWRVDGVPAATAGDAEGRGGPTKLFDDSEGNTLRAEEGEPRVEVPAREPFELVLGTDPVEGEGPDGIWKRTEHGELFGRSVERLDVGTPDAETITVPDLGAVDDVDLDDPLPLEVVGHTDLPEGTVVAYALNGVVGAVTAVEPGVVPDRQLAHGFLPPDLFVAGANELTAYVVDGPPGGETLRPAELRDGD